MKPFDSTGAFRSSADLGGKLRQRAVQGAGATVFSNGLSLALQIVATIILARLLPPADFGLVAMVTTFSLLLVNFGLNGFTEAVLQREEMNHELASGLFWINLGTGLCLTVGFAAAGGLLAKFFNEPRVAHVAIGISLTIFLTSTSVLHLALLKRGMRFSATSVNDVISRIAMVAVSLLLAWSGWGYWALVAGAVVQPFAQSTGAWILCRWIPGLPSRALGIGPCARFALNVYGRFSVNYFARNLDNVLVGWRFGAQSLGFYKKAYDLFALSASQLVSPLTVVATAALSRLNPNSVSYRKCLVGALSIIAFVGMGLGADLTLVGKDVIRVLLGPGWDSAGRIFTFFGPGIGLMLLYGTHGWIHLSVGRADRWFRWGIVEFVFTGSLFVLGLPWGPTGVACAWTASFWILVIPAFWYAGKPIGLGIAPVLAATWRYFLASLLAGFASAYIVREIQLFSDPSALATALAHLALTTLVLALLYVGMVVLLHQSLVPVKQTVALFQEMLPWAGSSPKTTSAVPVTRS